MINDLGFKDTQEGFNRYMVECEFTKTKRERRLD